MKSITSTTNSLIKEVVRLRKRSARDETGLVIVEGFTEVRRAVDAGVSVKHLFICQDIFNDIDQFVGCDIINVTKEVFQKLAFGDRLKGILAVCHQPHATFGDLSLPPDPFVVIMEGVEKPGNLGAVLRTCDGAGVDLLIMCDGKTDIFNHNIVRSSIGTVFTVPTVSATKEDTLAWLKKNNIKTYAATAHADELYFESNFHSSSAILLGAEHEGLSDFWFKHADHTVTIPMKGQASCLNVAASAAILIYESVRQRSNRHV